jgi:hypothetical protein
MSRLKKLLLIVSALFLGLAALLSWVYYYQIGYSFAPEDPQQAVLAQKHADCIAFYLILSRPAKGQKEPDTDWGKSSKIDMEGHTKKAFMLFPDKDYLKASVEAAIPRIRAELLRAGEGISLAEWVVKKDGACVKVDMETAAFISAVERRRAAAK